MTKRSVVQATFIIERTYPHPPARVFKAFADPEAKAKWFAGPDGYESYERSMDFRVGGVEVSVGRHGASHGGTVSAFHCVYQDIVQDERIVYSYRMALDGVPISVSQATLELRREGAGTKLVLTEYGVYLDGYEDGGSREEGTNWVIDQMGKSLEAAAV